MKKPIRKPGMVKSESSKLRTIEIKGLKSKIRELEEKLSKERECTIELIAR